MTPKNEQSPTPDHSEIEMLAELPPTVADDASVKGGFQDIDDRPATRTQLGSTVIPNPTSIPGTTPRF